MVNDPGGVSVESASKGDDSAMATSLPGGVDDTADDEEGAPCPDVNTPDGPDEGIVQVTGIPGRGVIDENKVDIQPNSAQSP
jgi:hypothetical protein